MLDAIEVEADGSQEVDVGAEAIEVGHDAEVTLEPSPQKDYGRSGARASTDRAPSAAQPAPAASSMAKKLDSIFDRILETDYLEDAKTIDKRTDTDEQPSLSRGMSEEELIELARAHRPAFTAPPGARMGNTKSASAKAGPPSKRKRPRPWQSLPRRLRRNLPWKPGRRGSIFFDTKTLAKSAFAKVEDGSFCRWDGKSGPKSSSRLRPQSCGRCWKAAPLYSRLWLAGTSFKPLTEIMAAKTAKPESPSSCLDCFKSHQGNEGMIVQQKLWIAESMAVRVRLPVRVRVRL